MQKKKALESAFFKIGEEVLLKYNKNCYKVKFIIIILDIGLHEYNFDCFCNCDIRHVIMLRIFLKKFKIKISIIFLLTLFLISFYIFSILIEFIISNF